MSKTEMHKFNTIIIGTGAAGYAAADALRRHGVTDIAIVTNGKNCGTSRNIGSDKQTYYKPSQDGQTEDSAAALAWDYMDGGCCDGVLAYVEGANSMRCFYRLLELGVYFPQDKYGAFPSYKTDHDRGGRATSIGPLTSKSMVECLEKQVLERDKTPIFDDMQVVKILRKKDRVYGIAALCKGKTLVSIFAKNVIFATGAPANIYAQSVYPQSQRGATGVLIDAGVKLVNFCEWQYGLASLKFRWNLSGTYLQVMPHIYSEDEQGKKYDFIYDALGANGIAAVFRKGSQWPFDAAKIDGTSRLDMLIHAETSAKRRVFLDYRRNPTGYDFKALPKDVRDYLQERESVFDTPIGRMERLNPKAIELYMSKGIDLYSEPLEAAICAQHNNGGVLVDEHCRTNLEGLYVIGEAAGIFGLTRPGGSALNSTQVTALRAARAIAGDAASGDDDLPTTDEDFADVIKELQTQISTVKID
ncbi:MAG: FAD-binding protein, partial [Oscillospiraceae bacterium]|nr:FAD-binding protein [Oscillospiraceae bacterium]